MLVWMRNIQRLVFIATCPRSGSSLLAGILNRCGAFGGDTIGRTKGNPKGQYENRAIGISCFVGTLEKYRTNPARLLEMAQNKRVPEIPGLKRNLTYLLNAQGYRGGVAYYKGGPYSFLFDEVNRHFPSAIWLLPRRDSESIQKSLKKLLPDRNTDFAGEVSCYQAMQSYIKIASRNAHWVDMDRFMAGDWKQLQLLVNQIGLNWNEKEIQGWVDPGLWHHRINK